MRELELDKVRKELEIKILDFIRNPDNNGRALHVKIPQGVGKTYTVSRLLFSQPNCLTVWLGPKHEQVQDEIEIKCGVFHLKGLRQRDEQGNLCDSLELLELSSRWNIPMRTLCNMCQNRHFCRYREQFKTLNKPRQNWCGVHHHLNMEYLSDYFSESSCAVKCLVIDENPLMAVNKRVLINTEDLRHFIDIILEILISNFYPICGVELVDLLYIFTTALISVINENYDHVVSGFKLIKKLKEKVDFLYTFDEVRQIINPGSRPMKALNRLYFKKLRDIWKNKDESRYFKNILDCILDIVKKCLEYDKLKVDYEINTPFWVSSERRAVKNGVYCFKNLVYNDFRVNLPNVPIVILDATTNTESYRVALGIPVELYSVKAKENVEIIQIVDGFYYKSSLFRDSTRLRLYELCNKTVLKHQLIGEKMVNIIIRKDFANLSSSDSEYKGKTIEEFLERNGEADRSRVRIEYYNSLRGINKMQNDETLIILGVPEPNVWELKMQICLWYAGEREISIERLNDSQGKIEGVFSVNIYKDERLQREVESLREQEIEQAIGRLRGIISDKPKKIYLLTGTRLERETRKVTINQLLQEIDNDLLKLGHVSGKHKLVVDGLEKGPKTTGELYKIVGGRYSTFFDILDSLLKVGLIGCERKNVGKKRIKYFYLKNL